MRQFKIGIISNHPAPYRDSVFAMVKNRNVIDIKVINLSKIDTKHSYWNLQQREYPNIFLRKKVPFRKNVFFHPGILSCLYYEKFDVMVIPGFNHLTSIFCLCYCVVAKIPYVLSIDTLERSINKKTLRRWIVVLFIKLAAAFWVPGKATRKYLNGLGVSDAKIYEGCYTLDCSYIQKCVKNSRLKRSSIRDKIGIPQNAHVFLMVANMEPKRRHDILLRAYSHVHEICKESFLLIVGTGHERDKVDKIIKENELQNVKIIDSIPFQGLSDIFACSDVYIHTGSEPYSTSISYAAIAGLPVISVKSVGATYDYVKHSMSGFVLNQNDGGKMANSMLSFCMQPESINVMGDFAANIAKERDVLWAANQFEEAVYYAVGEKGVYTS